MAKNDEVIVLFMSNAGQMIAQVLIYDENDDVLEDEIGLFIYIYTDPMREDETPVTYTERVRTERAIIDPEYSQKFVRKQDSDENGGL